MYYVERARTHAIVYQVIISSLTTNLSLRQIDRRIITLRKLASKLTLFENL